MYPTLKQIGFNIKKARETKNLSREQLAACIDVHFRTLSKWENGQSDPPLSKMIEIAKILGLPLFNLLGIECKMTEGGDNAKKEVEDSAPDSGLILIDKEVLLQYNLRFAFLEDIITELKKEKSELKAVLCRRGMAADFYD